MWAHQAEQYILFLQYLLRVSLSSSRERARRHDWISIVWSPLGKRLLYLNGGPLSSVALNWNQFYSYLHRYEAHKTCEKHPAPHLGITFARPKQCLG